MCVELYGHPVLHYKIDGLEYG